MRYRSLGTSGLVVSVAGLGGNNFGRRLDVGATRAVVDAAMDAGITLIDTADIYSSGRRRSHSARCWPAVATRWCWRPSSATGTLTWGTALIGWAQQHGVTVLDVAVGGLAAQPGCSSVIAGATSPEQVKANAQAASWVPAADELADLDRLVPGPSAAG
jgi:aryl-alcohol dehydrogenase-like predicted oxidoreductase